jgi:HEAT repeats
MQSSGAPAIESFFATEVAQLDPSMNSRDPAERLSFTCPPAEGVKRFDLRSDQALMRAMFDDPSSMERERAVWEYADRHRSAAMPLLREIAATDADTTVRWTTLWLIQKVGGCDAADAIAAFVHDDHPEMRDWARLFVREITGRDKHGLDIRPARFDESNPFDQTLPLQIAGYARTFVPGMGWVQATLSPQWFESIMGRVMACTRAETFDTDLVIEKRVKGYHPDGSDHYEIYGFRGFTFEPAPGLTHHIYECQSRHTFYPSGKLEDASVEPFGDVGVVLNRVAMPMFVPVNVPIIPDRVTPQRETPPLRPLPPLKPERTGKLVQSVRGRYMGAAYVNVDRLMANGMRIGAGEVQLSSLHHPIVRKLTNTFLFGTFKGKLSDLDGDGMLEINTERSHGTIDAKLDYALRGVPNPDPFDPLAIL